MDVSPLLILAGLVATPGSGFVAPGFTPDGRAMQVQAERRVLAVNRED
jgi:hypothetical protein